jgi:dipeptide/tripeptide permease
MAVCALLLVIFVHRDVGLHKRHKTVREILSDLRQVLRNFRFMCLIVIVAGFWTIQGQIYSTMPKYVLRLLGEGASPEWLAAINPVVVVALVIPITHLVRSVKAEYSVLVSLLLIPLSALITALSPAVVSVLGTRIHLGTAYSIHPLVLMIAIGITMQAVAECFLSPKFMEFASKQAPPGDVGLYMGYTGLSTFLAWAFGFALSGHLLDRYCPDPATLAPEIERMRQTAIATGGPLPMAYAHAHYIWYFFAVVGAVAFAAMIVFALATGIVQRHSRTAKPQ